MILILDDVPGVIVAFQVALRRLAVSSQGAASVTEAMAILPRQAWTGFILDLELPDGNGVDFLEFLRRQARYAESPAVVITANLLVDADLTARIAAAGAVIESGAFITAHVDAICKRLTTRRTST